MNASGRPILVPGVIVPLPQHHGISVAVKAGDVDGTGERSARRYVRGDSGGSAWRNAAMPVDKITSDAAGASADSPGRRTSLVWERAIVIIKYGLILFRWPGVDPDSISKYR